MKYLFFIFTFLVLVAGIGSAATLSGSPSSLNFDLNVGEEECLIFSVSSSDYSGDLYSIMKWAGKDVNVSSPSDFVLNSLESGLNVTCSPESVSDFDGNEEVEICVLSNEIGRWRGSLEFRTESSGNIGVGVGTWLRVNVSDKPGDEIDNATQIPLVSSPSNSGGSSGGSSSGGSSFVVNGSVVNNSEKGEVEVVPLGELDEEVDFEDAGITGAVVGGNGGLKVAGIVLVIVGIGLALVYSRRKKYA